MNKMTKMIVTGLMLVSGLIAAPAQAATPDYLSFTAVGGDVTIGMKKFGKPAAVTFETSSNPTAETWETFAAGTTTIALADGDRLLPPSVGDGDDGPQPSERLLDLYAVGYRFD